MKKLNDRVSYAILFIPWFVIMLTFTFGVAGFNIAVSLTDWKGIMPSFGWAGLTNYRDLPNMTGFWETLRNVGILFGIGLPITVIVAVVFASFMDTIKGRFAGFFRSIAVASMALGGATVAVFWSWMFDYGYGGINQLLRLIGLEDLARDWIGNPNIVMGSVIIMLMWKFVGYGSLVVLGGLQGIPKYQIEAARMEGASTFQLYMKVLIPQVLGHIFTVTVLLSMYLLKSFDFVYVLTGGGPGWSSTLFPILVYRTMFAANNFAGGAAAANFMFLIVSVIAIPYLIWSRRESQGA